MRSRNMTVFVLTFLITQVMLYGCSNPTSDDSSSKGSYYKLNKYVVQTEKPAFVNILFQVTDSEDEGVCTLTTDDFVLTEDGSSISPTESGMTIQKMDQVPYNIRTVLVIDNSPSVRDVFSDIQEAAIELVNNMVSNQEVAILSFNSTITMVQGFTSSKTTLRNKIESISVPFGSYSTNLYGAIIEGVSQWEDSYDIYSEIEQGFLVAITDGSDEASVHSLSDAIQSRGNKAVYTIGLGSEIDTSVLSSLGNKGFYQVSNISNLKSIYSEIQNDIVKYANSFYWLYYISGLRDNSNHSIKLTVKNNSNSKSSSYITGNFSSSGFEDLPGGVFVNSTESDLDGIDQFTVFEDTISHVTATSYWNQQAPSYTWESSNTSVATVHAVNSSGSSATITAINQGSCTITVTDTNNISYHASFSKDIDVRVRSVGNTEIQFVTIPGGTFQMGDEVGDIWDFCRPVHTVTISTFDMSAYEITNAKYAQYLNEALASGDIELTSGDVYGKTGSWSGQRYLDIGYGSGQNICWVNYNSGVFSVTSGYEDWPVVAVTWYGAKAFVEHYDLDLPREAEWEYASRWGNHQYMYGTNDGTINNSNSNFDSNIGHPVAVGSYPANPFGLYDMAGNVWEWCADWYGDYSSENLVNPTGAQTGDYRVRRGGDWSYPFCRSSVRSNLYPNNSISTTGFRVVRRLAQQ